MGSIPRRNLTGVRFSAGTRVKGRWVEGAQSVITFKASVQPISPEIMATVPEGRRDSARFALFTDFRLMTANDEAVTNADRVTIDGVAYEVFAVDIWQNNLINYYMALVATIKDL